MMSEINKLRMELRAELELMDVRGAQMARAMDKTNVKIDRLVQHVDAVAKQFGEVAEDVRWFKGRYKKLGDRFDKILEAVAHGQTDHGVHLQNLDARVTRLEEERTG